MKSSSDIVFTDDVKSLFLVGDDAVSPQDVSFDFMDEHTFLFSIISLHASYLSSYITVSLFIFVVSLRTYDILAMMKSLSI